MTSPTKPALVPLALTEDVYDIDSEFRSTAKSVIDMLDGDSSEETVRSAAEIAKDAIGADPVKLFALIDVMHDKVMHQWNWATRGAVNFYRVLFKQLDLAFLDDVGFEGGTTSGAEIAVTHIIDKCMAELDNCGDWGARSIACMLEFFDNSFEQGDNFMTAAATGNIVAKMAASFYLFFDMNLLIFSNFCLCVVSRIDSLHPEGKSEQLNEVFRQLQTRQTECTPDQSRSIEELLEKVGRPYMMPEESETQTRTGDADYYQAVAVPLQNLEYKVEKGLEAFTDEANWGCSTVSRLVNGVSDGMKIGASPRVELATYAVIDAMINSDKLFEGGNLKTLAFLLLRIGPALDAMASSDQSQRLTALLDTLKAKRGERTEEHRRDIEGLCRNLGRMYTDADATTSDTDDEQDDYVAI